jgi:hypothetical protein
MSIQSSVDSCFTPPVSHTPSRSIDVTKAAAKARSTENLRHNYQRKNSSHQSQTPRTAKSAGTSRAASRPCSRGSSKHRPGPVKYTIIPHQRTPSQPIISNRSPTSSAMHLPPRPATRDAPTPQYASSRPSVSSPSVCRPAVNFSRKFPLDPDCLSVRDTSDRDTSPNPTKKHKSRPVARESTSPESNTTEITALPPMPTKRPSGLRRVFSSLSVRRGKSMREKDLWMQKDVWHQTPPVGAVLAS